MRKKTVLLILIDGFRHDYVNHEDAPFLHSLCDLNISGPVRETFAFELRPAFFAGLQPEECNVANMFYYNPEGSPFKSMDVSHGDRARITQALRAEAQRKGYTLAKHIGSCAEIPFELLKYFDFSEKYHTADENSIPGRKTLFDHLRAAGKKWLWIGYPDGPGTTAGVLEQFNNRFNMEEDFIYLHFSELDWVGHDFGPHSPEQKKVLKEIDDAVREVYKKLNQSFTDVRGVIFGDHGQVEIKKNIDMEAELKKSGLVLEKDYIYFLDSTQARFWFFNDIARAKVAEILSSIPDGRVLKEGDLARLRFRFADNRFGEMIFVVNDGVGIFPNFFQHDKPCKGLHGYLPEVEGNWAKLIVTGCGVNKKLNSPVEMVDIYPTLLEMLDLERPVGQGARSVFETINSSISSHRYEATVMFPTYNRLETLKKCITAIEAQTMPKDKFEVIVVDDGSTDGTLTFLDDYAGRTNLNFKHFSQKNSGPAGARNLALKNALGKVIVLIGDDMIMEPGFTEGHIRFHDEWPGLGHACIGLTEWSKDIDVNPLMEYITKEGGQQFCFDYLASQPDHDNISYGFFWSSNISFKRLLPLTYGLFNSEVFKHAMWEDVELGYRLNRAGLVLHFRKGLVVYHEHRIDFEKFAERQRMVGWYSHDLASMGVPLGYGCTVDDRARFYSRRALNDIVSAVKSFEKDCGDKEILKRLYEGGLYFAAIVGYKEREGGLREDAGGTVALLHNLSLSDKLVQGIAEKYRQIAEKDRQLAEKDKQLESLMNSYSWKITAPMRKVLGWFKA